MIWVERTFDELGSCVLERKEGERGDIFFIIPCLIITIALNDDTDDDNNGDVFLRSHFLVREETIQRGKGLVFSLPCEGRWALAGGRWTKKKASNLGCEAANWGDVCGIKDQGNWNKIAVKRWFCQRVSGLRWVRKYKGLVGSTVFSEGRRGG